MSRQSRRGEGQDSAEDLTEAPFEYTVDHIVRHVGEGENVKYIFPWYGYMPADDLVDLHEHISKDCINCTGRWVQREDARWPERNK